MNTGTVMPKKARYALGLIIVLAAWILLQMVQQIRHQLGDFPEWRGVQGLLHAILLDLTVNHYLVSLLFNGLMIYLACVALWHLIVQGYLAFKLQRMLDAKRNMELSKQWSNRLGGGIPIVVIDEPSFVAFACGLFKRRVILSSGALGRFGDKEAEAIALHEIYHCKKHHPLLLTMLVLLGKGFAFVPVIADLGRYCAVWMELLADRYAIKQTGSPYPIGQVLLSLARNREFKPAAIWPRFADSSVPHRINQILYPSAEPKLEITTPASIIISGLVLLFMSLFLFGFCL
ncbi:M56 family metallopeptidase [Paenibacillus sp. CAU 1782]